MRYLEFKILLEYNRAKSVEALGPDILQRTSSDAYLKSKTAGAEPQDIIDTVLSAAEDADPTPNKQYVVWIVRQFTKNKMKYEDLYKLNDELGVFYNSKAQHKRLNIDSDINRYDWRTINDVVEKINSTEVDSEKANALNVADTKVLYNGPLGILAIPETEAASCELGSRTKWCTAASKSENRFHQYNDQGPLYVWIDQQTKRKFQFHFETFQFMNELDHPLQESQLLYFAKQNPVTKKLFAGKQSQIDRAADEYIDYLTRKAEYEDDPAAYQDEYGGFEENQDWDEIEPDALFLLASPEVINKNLKYIKRESVLSYHYAKNIVKGAWPEGEKAILMDNYQIVPYAQHVLKARWPKGEDWLLRRIHSDTLSAVKYAKAVVGGRWPEAEERGRHYASFVLEYSEQVLNSRWPEAEQYFDVGRYGYYKYAIKRYLEHFKITVDDLNTTDEKKAALKQSIGLAESLQLSSKARNT